MIEFVKGLFKKKRQSKDTQIWTMTKKWINRLLWFGCAWITWSYVLATYAAMSGNYTVCENLSKSVVKFVIATILGYMVKSYFETYSEKKNELVKAGYDKFSSPKVSLAEDYDSDESESFLVNDNVEDIEDEEIIDDSEG